MHRQRSDAQRPEQKTVADLRLIGWRRISSYVNVMPWPAWMERPSLARHVPALTSRRRNNLGFTKLAEEKCPQFTTMLEMKHRWSVHVLMIRTSKRGMLSPEIWPCATLMSLAWQPWNAPNLRCTVAQPFPPP